LFFHHINLSGVVLFILCHRNICDAVVNSDSPLYASACLRQCYRLYNELKNYLFNFNQTWRGRFLGEGLPSCSIPCRNPVDMATKEIITKILKNLLQTHKHIFWTDINFHILKGFRSSIMQLSNLIKRNPTS
jgi:hypothetical protein